MRVLLYIRYLYTAVIGEILLHENVFGKSLPLPLTHHMPLNINSLNVNYIFKYLKVNSVSIRAQFINSESKSTEYLVAL